MVCDHRERVAAALAIVVPGAEQLLEPAVHKSVAVDLSRIGHELASHSPSPGPAEGETSRLKADYR